MVNGKIDELRGLKENVIVGRLVPAGTGLAYHADRKCQKGQIDENRMPETKGIKTELSKNFSNCLDTRYAIPYLKNRSASSFISWRHR